VFVGAAVTGFGDSLVYPGFGVEAVRGAQAFNRGGLGGRSPADLLGGAGLAVFWIRMRRVAWGSNPDVEVLVRCVLRG